MEKQKTKPTLPNPSVVVLEQLLKQARVLRKNGTPEVAEVASRKEQQLARELEEAKAEAAAV